jgi:hypothetical protein
MQSVGQAGVGDRDDQHRCGAPLVDDIADGVVG